MSSENLQLFQAEAFRWDKQRFSISSAPAQWWRRQQIWHYWMENCCRAPEKRVRAGEHQHKSCEGAVFPQQGVKDFRKLPPWTNTLPAGKHHKHTSVQSLWWWWHTDVTQTTAGWQSTHPAHQHHVGVCFTRFDVKRWRGKRKEGAEPLKFSVVGIRLSRGVSVVVHLNLTLVWTELGK